MQDTTDVINLLVLMNATRSIIEIGCTDGWLASLLSVPSYTGVALNSTTLQTCMQRYGTVEGRRFVAWNALGQERAELCLSLDVLHHLADESIYAHYMHTLFNASRRLVLIRAGNPAAACTSPGGRLHHRPVTGWVEQHRPDFVLLGGSASNDVATASPHTPAAAPRETDAQFMLFQRTDTVPMRG